MIELLKEIPLWLLTAISFVVMACLSVAVATGREVDFWGFKIGTKQSTADTNREESTSKEKVEKSIEYIPPPNIPDLKVAARSVDITEVYICATSLGRSAKYITELLDNTMNDIHVFCVPPRKPFLVSANIEESKGVLKALLNNYQGNNRLHIYTTDNPPSLGFIAFCNKSLEVQLCFIHWYTFSNGFTTQRGRGKNGTLVLRRGISPDADALLNRLREIITEKLEDNSLKKISAFNDIIAQQG